VLAALADSGLPVHAVKLAVRDLPGSGQPPELLHAAGMTRTRSSTRSTRFSTRCRAGTTHWTYEPSCARTARAELLVARCLDVSRCLGELHASCRLPRSRRGRRKAVDVGLDGCSRCVLPRCRLHARNWVRHPRHGEGRDDSRRTPRLLAARGVQGPRWRAAGITIESTGAPIARIARTDGSASRSTGRMSAARTRAES
jgi:hypothetical protein